jgi:hypothetical protein
MCIGERNCKNLGTLEYNQKYKKTVFRIRICIQIRTDFGRLDPDPDMHWECGSGSGSRRAKRPPIKEKV